MLKFLIRIFSAAFQSQRNPVAPLATLAILITGCALEPAVRPSESACRVFLRAGDAQTRTSLGPDGVSVNWRAGDRLSLWASRGGDAVFANQEFRLYGSSGSSAVFTADLPSPMEMGEYTYYACCPRPSGVDGTTARFSLPSSQDGEAGGGADIMISGPVQSGPLSGNESGLSLPMRHLVHLFNFHISGDGTLNGEPVRRAVVRFPCDVVGTVVADMTASAGPRLENGLREVAILPQQSAAQPLVSRYLTAAVFPFSAGSDDFMEVSLFSEHWQAEAVPVPLRGLDFAPGHATPVRLDADNVKPYFSLAFHMVENCLGEKVSRISFSSPLSRDYIPASALDEGDSFSIEFADEQSYLSVSGRRVTVEFESANAVCTTELTLPDLGGGSSAVVNLAVPYLLFEDFSSVPAFSSNDAYVTSSMGSKGAYSFLSGWTGGRIGAEAGKCIRIAGRREAGLGIDAHYPARVDSAPLSRLKNPVDIEVTFDYGADQKGINTYGQNVTVGYVTIAGGLESGSSAGTFESGNGFTAMDTGGSYDNTPETVSFVLHNVPAGDNVRICWRDDPVGNRDIASNTTTWLYIDNVKVKIIH